MRLPEYEDLTDRGKEIHAELQAVYSRHPKSPETFSWDVNVSIAQRLDLFIDGHLDTHRRFTKQEFINIIWMNWPGGGTAEIAANRILNRIGVDLDDD